MPYCSAALSNQDYWDVTPQRTYLPERDVTTQRTSNMRCRDVSLYFTLYFNYTHIPYSPF